MTIFNEELRTMRDNVERKRHLKVLLSDLTKQKKELSKSVEELEIVMNDEQTDVDKLEGLTLTSILYTIIGKKGDKLMAEREEAYAAKMKYDTAAAELKDVNDRISSINAELEDLLGCEEKYQSMLNEKNRVIKASGGESVIKIMDLEERIAIARNRKTEIREAFTEGKAAREIAKNLISNLNDAEGYGTWDLIGGGLLVDVAKHDAIDRAEACAKKLQVQLRRFKTELTDLTINENIDVDIDSFSRFADFFFDGFFSNLSVLNQIEASQQNARSVVDKINGVIKRLRDIYKETEAEIEGLEWELGQLITDTVT